LALGGARSEQTRARYPDSEGFVERDGVRTFYEVYGSGAPTVLLLPPWSIVHSRCWKMQIPYLSRHCRVVTFDGRGNGRSDRPPDVAAYAEADYAADALAVLDATETDSAVVVAWSVGAQRAVVLAAEHPRRVSGLVFIGPAVPFGRQLSRAEAMAAFDELRPPYDGWFKFNRHYWLQDYEGFLSFFMSEVFTDPHSTKQIEDAIGWGMETSPETLIATALGPEVDEPSLRELVARIRCPALVIHGTDDAIRSHESGATFAELMGATFVSIEGSGHGPHARQPVKVNRLIRDFACPPKPAAQWTRATRRRKRALYISSPIGLGHAQRDIAIADELRRLHPDLEIDWLAQHPVTTVLQARGERIHPSSAQLANESHHIESESAEHDLQCFQALRRMDEILLANFMVFHDIVRDQPYDLWIGDEAWELDYYLHENPEEKRAAYVWLTDFVGFLPMPDGGASESLLTADYNAEMIEQIARYPRVRDRAIFVGNSADIVPDTFGPDLPSIREWTDTHFDFAGYVTGFDPAQFADRERIRAELGYGPDERICIVTVGGSGVGLSLLRKVVDAYPAAKRLVPNLRMVVVAGPRIDPANLPAPEGVEVRAYVHELYRHLAVCDLAIVQGGLTTCMELAASRRPFLYFPLRHHFEQNFHVRHRLQRYGAGRCMDYEQETSTSIAEAMAQEIGRQVDYAAVETDGAARAARLMADLV
jgi:pimeloyl-ACP methyl ester carboxylesterase/predicted glycosyltransferase